MKKAFLFILLLSSAGCATKQAVAPKQVTVREPAKIIATLPAAAPVTQQPTQTIVAQDELNQEIIQQQGQPIEVVSDPAGASIEMNGKSLGVAPGTFFVIRQPNRYGFLPRMTITATPAEGARGQYVQTKVYDGYTETPARIFFNMSETPPIPKIEGD